MSIILLFIQNYILFLIKNITQTFLSVLHVAQTRMFVLRFLLIFIVFIACNEESSYSPPMSGYYGDHVILAYNESTKEFSGIYQTNINVNEEPTDSCYFYFVGKFAGEKTNVISWRIGHRLGEIFGIMTMKDSLSFDLSFEKNHINCTLQQGVKNTYTLNKKTDWRYIRTVKMDTASLYASSSSSPLDTLLRKGEILKIIDKKIDWVQTTRGWVREEDLIRFPG